MHTIIVCGTPWCKLKTIQQILNEAGVSTARAEPSSNTIDISAWYERVFFDQHEPTSPLRVSKACELAVSQIFLTHWDQPVWGWSDSRSTWLLDFWRDFDETTHFVLFYTPAHSVLANALTNVSLDQFDHKFILDQWCAYQTEMLKFFHRNRNRCILLHADKVLAAPQSLIREINQQFKLNLHEQLNDLNPPEKITPLDLLLVQQFLQSHPATLALEQEIHASLSTPQDVGLPTLNSLQTTPEAAAAQLRQLYLQQANLQITRDRDVEQLTELQSQVQHLQQAILELEQVNNLLQRQLSQIQEDFASSVLHNQALQQRTTELEQERDAEAAAKISALAHNDALEQEKAGLHNQVQNQQQTQQEILHENESLLVQLHQVQEELEHYFLLHQQDKKAFEARWSRLMAHYPSYCEWDHIEVMETTESARWHIHGLIFMGNTLPLIDIGLSLENDTQALLLFPSVPAADSPWRHWSNLNSQANAPLEVLRLEPDAPQGSLEKNVLRCFATTDLALVQALCNVLAQALPTVQPEQQNLVQHLQKLKNRFEQLPATWRFDTVQLEHEQRNPGYEHLCFKFTNACFGKRLWPEFELRLAAASVKEGKFSVHPRLEFPLPAQGNKQFENWFNESENELGPKFEFRLDIQSNAVDINAWRVLNITDQLQMLSIMATLPRVLSQLEQQGTNISRPWSDWQQLVISMQETMQKLGLPSVTFETL